MIHIATNQYIKYIINSALTILCLTQCHSLYWEVWKSQKIDYANLLILGVLFYITWLSLYQCYITRNEPTVPILKENVSNFKIINIEFLRLVFTLIIVLHHTFKSLGIANRGWYGVEFFFMLSGFFLVYTFNNNCLTLDFIRKKIVRFVPLIVVGSFLNILYHQDISISKFLSAIFFMPGTGLFPEHSYLGPAWYLSVLFWVSILYFYIMKNFSPSKRNLIIGILTFIACLIFIRGASLKWGAFTVLGQKDTIEGIILMTLVRGIMNMGIGYFIAIYWIEVSHNFEHKYNSNKQYFLFGIIEIVMLIYSTLMLFNNNLFPSQAIFVHISFIALIYLWLIRKGFLSNLTNNILFLKLSKYLLGIYLCHSCIAEHLIPLLRRKYPDIIMGHSLLVIISSIISSIIIGIWAHYVIEKPGEKLLRKVVY